MNVVGRFPLTAVHSFTPECTRLLLTHSLFVVYLDTEQSLSEVSLAICLLSHNAVRRVLLNRVSK